MNGGARPPASVRVAALALLSVFAIAPGAAGSERTFAIVDTGQDRCYEVAGESSCPEPGQEFFGQDAQYQGNAPSYQDNGDGTITDRNTGLMWQKRPIFFKRTQEQAGVYAANLSLAGHDDWRLPTIKELFSIADFRGNMRTRTPYIDTTVFDFEYPEANQGQSGTPGHREMDAQYASATHYRGVTMGRDSSAFGFNFADGRIKSYPLRATRYVRAVRGNPSYGLNRFEAHGDGTITDHATGLIWQQRSSRISMDWKQALSYAESLELAGHDDWRLPDVKELQSIVDYTRAPDATEAEMRAPAIDPVFELSEPESWFWTSTTHIENRFAYYVSFGQAFSARERAGQRINAHGAGAVRSDPKQGEPADWPDGLGPQADEIRIFNYVRAVRGGDAHSAKGEPAVAAVAMPGPERRNKSRNGNPKPAARAAAGELQVTTLGTGSPVFNPDRSGPSTLVRYGQRQFLVDMGEGTARRLIEAEVPLKGIAAFLFTHHHRDHDADAVSILPQAWSRGIAAPVVGPEGTRDLVDFLRSFYADDLEYRVGNRGGAVEDLPRPVVHELPLERPLSIGDVRITATAVAHTIATYAYRFDAGGKSIVVSGDLRYSESLIELARDCDILVIDSGGIVYEGDAPTRTRGSEGRVRKEHRAHATLEEVARMARGAGARTLVLTHFRPGTVDEARTLERMRQVYSGEIVFAEDLETFR